MIDRAALLELIPHRPPFRFLDEVVEIDGRRVVTTWCADPGAEFFRGHYPGRPLMPGVLLCECCFQAGALLIAHARGGWSPSDGIPVITRITDARFKHMVHPGDALVIEVTIDDVLDRAYFLTGRIAADGTPVARVSFACMLAEEGR